MPGCRLVRACVAGWGHVRRKTGKLGRVQTGHGDDLPSDGGKKWIEAHFSAPRSCIPQASPHLQRRVVLQSAHRQRRTFASVLRPRLVINRGMGIGMGGSNLKPAVLAFDADFGSNYL